MEVLANLRWESKKLFYKQKILLFIIIYLLLKYMISYPDIIAGGRFKNDAVKLYYNQYMEMIEGKKSEDTEKTLKEKVSYIEEQSNKIRSAKNDYINKKIDHDQYQKLMAESISIAEKSDAMQIILSQNDAIDSVPKEYRYLFDYKPDQTILMQNYDYLFAFLLILFSIATFYVDKETEMDDIINTTKQGNRYSRKIKIFIMCSSIFVLDLINELLFMLLTYNHSGALHFFYPIQCIPDFASIPFELTIGSMYIIEIVLKLVGYCLIALLISYASLKIKKISTLYGLSIFILILPPILFQNIKWLYYVPFLGFPLPQFYFRDSIMIDNVLIYERFQGYELALVICIAIILFFILLKLLSHTSKKPIIHTKKFILVLCILLMMGCSNHKTYAIKNKDIYNYKPLAMYEISGNKLYMKSSKKYQVFDLDKRITSDFDRDITQSFSNTEIRSIDVVENDIYYLRINDSYNFCIAKRDLNSNHETEIYSNNSYQKEADNLVPFIKQTHQIPDNAESPQAFYINNDKLFLIYNTYIELVDLSTGKNQKILNDIYDISIIKNHIYYTNLESNLMKFDIDSNKSNILFDDLVDQFEITSQGIYYTNLNDYKKLYFYNFSDSSIKKISDDIVISFSLYKDIIAYNSEGKLYIYDLENKNLIHTLDIDVGFKLKVLDEEYLVFEENYGNTILYNFNSGKSIKVSNN